MKRLPIDNRKKKILLNFRVDKFLFTQIKNNAEITGQDVSSFVRETLSDKVGVDDE